jgi:DNA-binding NarL/FixJ family response regulator
MTENASIKLLIVDHQPVVLEGLKQILKADQGLSIVGTMLSGFDAIKLTRQTPVDIVLMEIALPDRNGLEVLKQIKKENPQISIIIFSGLKEDQYAVRALKSGASGYLNKHSSAAEILNAIRVVASGLKYISPELAQELANNLNQEFDGEPHRALSDREFQTLTMIATGKSVSDIAKELSLSVKTISEYRARVLLKMKLRHNAELTHYAIKNQLVE